MSTRSEIRFYVGKKQESCIYHHSDGYPEHIVEDLAILGMHHNFTKTMKELAKNHGTGDPECSSGDKGKTYQGDIEYSYEVYLKKEGSALPYYETEKVKIFKHDDWKDTNKKELIFDGTVGDAYRKYVCPSMKKFCKKQRLLNNSFALLLSWFASLK